ncbi:unnamed protein product [Chrysodeixis includens]|uniref:Glucose-methanol-choline oxidoreductase N-terminal domain-containing protein n=1 Tax=Chrysodeixis includens TaxID=689277 RepID=A0A9P0FR85_CHRIL|nr:unnamed protein product [Chrysodeixis includens]
MQCYNSTCLSPTIGVAPQIFASALQFFAATQCLLSEKPVPDADVRNLEKFDFIIVGAGTAGSILANRLSAINDWSVLLIEAGDDEPVEAKIPVLNSALLKNKKYDWAYQTAPNGKNNLANKNESVNWPRGKILGGSSNLNAMIYVQGNDEDYKNWYDAGNKEWSVEEVRRCFRKAESFQDMKALENPVISNHYGHNGPLIINTFNSTYGYSKKVLCAWDEMGIRNVEDLNEANVMGSGIMRATAADGIRQSHNRAYLNPVVTRKNLKIMKNSFVTKILIKNLSKTAYGVEVRRKTRKYRLLAGKEVIISAGAINSPQLLMLSGIGPREHLRAKGISVVVDSPMVGQNLQDHILLPIPIYGDEPGEKSVADQQFAVIQYLYNRTGSLAENRVANVLAFYSENKNATYPDFQSHLHIIWKNDSNLRNLLGNIYNYKDQVVNPIVKMNQKHAIYMHAFNLLHPHSKGNISLVSNDPYDYPIIHNNYFSDPRDLESAVTGIKMLTKVVNTTYFRSVRAFLGRMEWPACNVYELDSREYWKCVSVNMSVTVYHPVGTCMMGPDPTTSVVSSRLKVHGVNSLRVIDASIMPNITSGNTNGPVTAIGERGAELVIEDHMRASESRNIGERNAELDIEDYTINK